MSEKKKFGKFLALATAAGAVAAGVSYFLKYRSFHKELDQDFHDFEHEDDDDFDGSLPHESEAASRTYVTLGEKKEETKETAKEAAQEVADAADEVSRQTRLNRQQKLLKRLHRLLQKMPLTQLIL
jgi:uncharacterized protein YpiB (UPF0302 family)